MSSSRLLRIVPLWLLVPLFLVGCASYQIGNKTLYPADIHTVYVPVFQSVSFRRNLGERITEAVVKEIENRTPFKVVNDPNADSVLTGKLVSENKTVLVPTLSGDAREIQVGMRIEVHWLDRKGRKLRDGGSIPCPEDVASINATGDLVPEVGQSVTTAQQDAICSLAKQVVDLMETPW